MTNIIVVFTGSIGYAGLIENLANSIQSIIGNAYAAGCSHSGNEVMGNNTLPKRNSSPPKASDIKGPNSDENRLDPDITIDRKALHTKPIRKININKGTFGFSNKGLYPTSGKPISNTTIDKPIPII
jgi:hypothetical protein